MPKIPDVKCVLVIGSGPVVIGQAAEFDYAGSQACLSLREEGVRVVLINSNPATIQTDHAVADRVYLEPITVENIVKIIKAENVDSIIATMGGQTGLNMAVELDRRGILRELNVRILGTGVESIRLAENRTLFHRLMEQIGEPIPESYELSAENYMDTLQGMEESAYIVRTSFTLGGSGGTIVPNLQKLREICDEYFRLNPEETIEVERSIAGLKELEYEVIRDSAGNCITVCNMENLDPMGVHTGESIVVTPSQTLSDEEYHMLRDAAIHVISALDIKGACNIQFALDSREHRYYVVEVNPRTSRSSALASKASGYPIARVSAKIALGYLLPEIRNPITGNTYAAYEPSLDYITVKIPRWPFDKFHVDRTIGVQMKSIGEVMGIGRTFEEALMKAVASLETEDSRRLRLDASDSELRRLLTVPNDRRLFAVFEALFRGWRPEDIAEMCGYPDYFVHKMKNIVDKLKELEWGKIPDNLYEFKRMGIPDYLIARFTGISEADVVRWRLERGILPAYKSIDTCSGEFQADTPYLYSTYESESEFLPEKSGKSIIVMGSGPNRISQGLEFDYGSVKAVMALRALGIRTIMVNSNPETVSTDFDVSDALYFEPLTLEHVSNIVARERADGIIIQFSGQTGQNMAGDLGKLFGEGMILGTKPSSINRIEDRGLFANALNRLGLLQPEFAIVSNDEEAIRKTEKVGLPVIVRSSFIIGGRAMDILYDIQAVRERVAEIFKDRPGYPVVVSRYIESATEMDVDFVSDGMRSVIAGISVHIEEAGTHSGDATMVLGPGMVPQDIYSKIVGIVDRLTLEFGLCGLSNLQVAVKSGDVYIIELNARSSRSLPFVAKATGVDWVREGVLCMLGGRLSVEHVEPRAYFVKVPVFPFKRFRDLDTVLGPEMKSTGEGFGAGMTLNEAIYKASQVMFGKSSLGNSVLITVSDRDKPDVLRVARKLREKGFKIYSTPGTKEFLSRHGIEADVVYRIDDVRRPRVDEAIALGLVSFVINTPTDMSGSIRDGFEIRRVSIMKGTPLVTNVRLAEALVDSLLYNTPTDAREISEYWVCQLETRQQGK
ncbi:carbamoyl-phosphate synthase (glutamine-hydrolyzing) large subunit [Thermogymnomonas acidicola]|uniref:carbamoyl-phosphate synthase (glutamine-hydrolyzing) large subunit n=1 Tax=Thermogymnomonas acidicola TaxID=399579 RepID=UPI001669432C|nr:carbamoyl-phosphate synthase (glutamine-hydrolyzing) large subunit [Thermogymnomonas acidicola]